MYSSSKSLSERSKLWKEIPRSLSKRPRAFFLFRPHPASEKDVNVSGCSFHCSFHTSNMRDNP